ncbi:hypothetical protein SLA2020_281320 [Shorea laevis]
MHELTGGQFLPHRPPRPFARRWGWGQRCVTPRQTCPRPGGFGRNLRSKTRWFTGFCNSHQVSHFATFFIDARAEISVAESRYGSRQDSPPARTPFPRRPEALFVKVPWRRPRWGSLFGRDARVSPYRSGQGARSPPTPSCFNRFTGHSAGQASTMILPQVHQRKPCYDFSFL